MADRITNPSSKDTPKAKKEEEIKTPKEDPKDPKEIEIKEEEVDDQTPAIPQNDPKVAELQAKVDQLTANLEKLMSQFKPDANGVIQFKSNASDQDLERHKSKAEKTADYVNAQPKVSVFIPLEGKESRGRAVLPVTINGHRWNVPKGIYVDVPRPVGDIVKESLNQTEEAYDNAFRLDKDSPGSARDEALR